ncbi:Transglycosylase SLT domain protein [Jannaschia seosinensis]|uniref:Transglycosylase SLT domain protein n=1 Tax=Jannaschia seosinensis TaxID=313367 RepID=A0A0M7BDU7_9RHOB|nr:transglycosylase SLT domain-containing protein [Jannaschia seosinensis]CUH40248.1 Transglycosylase SLT domain protein [Jannaschia seosinensis]
MTNRIGFKLRGLARRAAVAAVIGLAGAPVAADEAADLAPGGLVTVPSTMSTVTPSSRLAPDGSLRPANRPRVTELPDLRWDHIRGSSRWTAAAMSALDSHGQRLVDTVPSDIAQWCPAYPEAGEWERKAFWAGLLSTLAKHESTWRPKAVGGGGLWYGLVQILPATARGYGCAAKTGEDLKDGALNMSCAVRILNRTVPRDGVVARGMRGVAADWGPFHSSAKREDMRNWLTRQPFCNGLTASARPVPRPDWLGAPAGEADVVPLFVTWQMDKHLQVDGPDWSDFEMASDG